MNIFERGYVYDTVLNEFIIKAEREVNPSSLLSLGQDFLRGYFKKYTIIPVFRFLMLDSNETVLYDFSRDVMSANFTLSRQSGQRRSLTITLANYNGQWTYGAGRRLWVGTKIRFEAGVIIDGTVYWQTQGVFLLSDMSPTTDGSNRTVSVTFCDKWGLWDGSVYGATEMKTVIPAQTIMRQVFDTIVHEDNGLGEMWDIKPIHFDSQYETTAVTYTIKQDAGQNKSENLLKMANTISSDIYYDANGCMRIESNAVEYINNNFPVVWVFNEGDSDCGTPQIKFNRSKYYNKITTKGAIVNGYQFTGTAENKNPTSMYNTYSTPVTPKVNNNSKLYSDNLCLEQSMYEMVTQTRGLRSVTLTSAFLPFLDVDMGVYVNFPSIGVNNELYIIDSVSYSAQTDCRMSLSLTSGYEICI